MQKSEKEDVGDRIKENKLYLKGSFKLFARIGIEDRNTQGILTSISELIQKKYHELIKKSQGTDFDLKIIRDPHISLTKNYFLNYHQIKGVENLCSGIAEDYFPMLLKIDLSKLLFFKSEFGVRYICLPIFQGKKSCELRDLRSDLLSMIEENNLQVADPSIRDYLKKEDMSVQKESLLKRETREASIKVESFTFHVSILKSDVPIKKKKIEKLYKLLTQSNADLLQIRHLKVDKFEVKIGKNLQTASSRSQHKIITHFKMKSSGDKDK